MSPSHVLCCPHVSGGSGVPGIGGNGPADLPDAGLTERVDHLYSCQGLSTYRIAAVVGVGRQRVGRLLARSGVPVKPRGAGRRRPPPADIAAQNEVIEQLYLRHQLTSGRIAELTGVPERTVRSRLAARGVPMRSRGRCRREDRATVSAGDLAVLYLRAGLPAAQVGRLLGVSGKVVLRAAHDQGLPVRIGGPAPRGGPAEIELVEALYADRLVRRTLDRYGIRRIPPGGPISVRFPAPVRLRPAAARELYQPCGLALRHIELLTGQPAETVRRLLRTRGVRLRPKGGRSPFLRRWRAGS